MPNKAKEQRSIACEFRVSPGTDNSTTIGGYAAVFNTPTNIGQWIETIDPHAFDAVLKSDPDTRCLFNHNSGAVLGRTSSGTLKLSVDEHGLAYECPLPDTSTARDLIASMQRGDIRESSFGFIVSRDKWSDNPDGSVSRTILEVSDLLDVSPVAFPAYTSATAGVRFLPASMPVEMRSRIEGGASSRGSECECDCPECVDGDCAECSDPACTDPACDCNQRALRSRMGMRLRLCQV